VACPFCREDWGSGVLTELRAMDKQLRKRAARGHKGTMCASCLMTPIKGSLHRCVRCAPRFELCQGCFPRSSAQHAHPFVRLPQPDALSQWEAVLPPPPPGRQADAEPTAAMQELMQRSITPADYDTLLALDQPTAPAAAPPMAQHLLSSLPRPRGGAAMGDCAFCRASMRADPMEHLRVLPIDSVVCHQSCVLAAIQQAPFGAVYDSQGNPVFPGLVSAFISLMPFLP
jgi:hypothetical protein